LAVKREKWCQWRKSVLKGRTSRRGSQNPENYPALNRRSNVVERETPPQQSRTNSSRKKESQERKRKRRGKLHNTAHTKQVENAGLESKRLLGKGVEKEKDNSFLQCPTLPVIVWKPGKNPVTCRRSTTKKGAPPFLTQHLHKFPGAEELTVKEQKKNVREGSLTRTLQAGSPTDAKKRTSGKEGVLITPSKNLGRINRYNLWGKKKSPRTVAKGERKTENKCFTDFKTKTQLTSF